MLMTASSWGKDHRQVYLIGNPFVWWLSTASIVAYAAIRVLLVLRAKRGYKDLQNSPSPLLVERSEAQRDEQPRWPSTRA